MMRFFTFLACAALPAAAICLCSCESQGYVSGVASSDAGLAAKSLKSRYYVAAARVSSESGLADSLSSPVFKFRDTWNGETREAIPDSEFQEECRKQLMERARASYPELFAKDGELCVPLSVDIKFEKGETYILGMLPFALSGTVVPGKEHDAFSLSVGLTWEPQAAPLKLSSPKSFPVEHICYMSILPWGLIYWGDVEKLSIQPRRYAGLEADYISDRRADRLGSLVDALALSIAENQGELSKTAPAIAGPPRSFNALSTPGVEAPATPPGGGVAPAQSGHAKEGGLENL